MGARLAELEAGFKIGKSKTDAVQAALFKKLAEHYRKRDALRLVVSYRKKFLDSLLRGGEEEAEQTGAEFRQAKAQTGEGIRRDRRGDGGEARESPSFRPFCP